MEEHRKRSRRPGRPACRERARPESPCVVQAVEDTDSTLLDNAVFGDVPMENQRKSEDTSSSLTPPGVCRQAQPGARAPLEGVGA